MVLGHSNEFCDFQKLLPAQLYNLILSYSLLTHQELNSRCKLNAFLKC